MEFKRLREYLFPAAMAAVLAGCSPAKTAYDKSEALNSGNVQVILESSSKVLTVISLEEVVEKEDQAQKGQENKKKDHKNHKKQSPDLGLEWVQIDDRTLVAAGSGTVLRDSQKNEYYVLTVNHVLPPPEWKNIQSNFIIASGHFAEVAKADSGYDLGLLKLPEAKNLPYFRGKIADEPQLGDFVAGAGYPLAEELVFFTGRIASKDLSEAKENYGALLFTVFDAHVTPGESGSGVFVFENRFPKLAGVVQVKYLDKEGLVGMSPVAELRDFLRGTPLEDDYL